MKAIQPYLVFNGQCAEAMNFYKQCLGGDLFVLPYDQSPIPALKGVKDRILHASLTAGTAELRASDAHPDKPARQGDNFHVFLQCHTPQDLERVFSALAEKGTVTLPLQEVFWGGRFGMLVDRFGVNWKLQSSN